MIAKAGFSQEEREELIVAHLPQVRAIARRILARSVGGLQIDDLISAGILGLIAAVDNFDPAQQTQLKTYADHRIRGAILDSMRDADFASRSARRKANVIEKAIQAAQHRLSSIPGDEEIASELSISVEEYRSWLLEVQNVSLECFDAPQFGDDEDSSLANRVSCSTEESPSQLLERAEAKKLLREAILRLPEREQKVLSLYYQHEASPGEIARIMNLRPSRVSQLKAQALLRLRGALAGRISLKV